MMVYDENEPSIEATKAIQEEQSRTIISLLTTLTIKLGGLVLNELRLLSLRLGSRTRCVVLKVSSWIVSSVGRVISFVRRNN